MTRRINCCLLAHLCSCSSVHVVQSLPQKLTPFYVSLSSPSSSSSFFLLLKHVDVKFLIWKIRYFFLLARERLDASDGCSAQCWKGDTLQMFPGRCAQGEDTLPAKGNNEYCIPEHPTDWLSFLSLKHPEKCGCEDGGGSVSYNRITLEREGWQVDKNFLTMVYEWGGRTHNLSSRLATCWWKCTSQAATDTDSVVPLGE